MWYHREGTVGGRKCGIIGKGLSRDGIIGKGLSGDGIIGKGLSGDGIIGNGLSGGESVRSKYMEA